MEQRIEKAIDNALDSASPQLYMFGVGFGIVLVILGIVLFFASKRKKGNGSKTNAGLICAVIGILAIVNGTVQMF
ncbi:hypothetical protein MNQ98_05915 [Paenibacillus sp. N3/727]|uniref:hypothetical protein n=1 Tax=Paenibacillus sp. N3/727 TaxID=2925845 RepID=UPI001F53BF27|nr:hypothetical protein [Paenibacillus sp. N3/727]UNK19565.1 hypothetical protein MNQ98_05915 [Paenibacillus sp. N3/727]